MVYIRGRLERESKQIVRARQWAAGLVTASFGVGFFLSEARRLGGSLAEPLNIAYLALFLIVGALVFLWIWATQRELDILFQWLDPKRYLPPSSLKETIMILGLAGFLIALLYAARDPLWFGLAFTSYSVAVPLATRYLNVQIAEAVKGSKERLEEESRDEESAATALLYRQGVDEVEHYFLKTPQMLRFALIAAFAAIGTVTAVEARMQHSPALGVAAYLVLSLTIIVSEVVIFRWRQQRDQRLYGVAVELSELLHDRI